MAKHSLEEAARSQLDPNFKSGIAIIDKIKIKYFHYYLLYCTERSKRGTSWWTYLRWNARG